MAPAWAHDPWCYVHPASVNRQRGERGSAGPSRPRAALEQSGCLNGCAVSVESVSSRIGLRPDHRVTCLSERGSHSSVRDGDRGDGLTETYRRTPLKPNCARFAGRPANACRRGPEVVPGSALTGGVAGFRADRQPPADGPIASYEGGDAAAGQGELAVSQVQSPRVRYRNPSPVARSATGASGPTMRPPFRSRLPAVWVSSSLA